MSVTGIENGAMAALKAANGNTENIGQERLFELMADNAHNPGPGGGTAELTQAFMNHMRGFVERNHDVGDIDLGDSFSPAESSMQAHKISEIPQPSERVSDASGQNNTPGINERTSGDMDLALRSLDALKDSYSRAIEIGLVSRGATQASGAVRSLLRGQ